MAYTPNQDEWIIRWNITFYECQKSTDQDNDPYCVANDVLTHKLMQSGCGYDSRKWNCDRSDTWSSEFEQHPATTTNQYRLSVNNHDDYSLCFTGKFDSNGFALFNRISAFPVYRLFVCADVGAPVTNCDEYPSYLTIANGFCAKSTCENAKKSWAKDSFHDDPAFTYHCAYQDAGSNWIVE